MKTKSAKVANIIKKELKKEYKDIKFKVRSDNFSQGNSVNIFWIGGPTREKVEAIVGNYQYGHFDGMEDIYRYSNRRDDIPQVKYISYNRRTKEA